MFIKIDDDNDHRGKGRAGAQSARPASGLRLADCGAKPIAWRERKTTGLIRGGEDGRIAWDAKQHLGSLTCRKSIFKQRGCRL
jgi:hypothetical protein